MAYDLEEQEQLDEIKTWWKTNGKLVIAAASAAIIGFVGWQSYGAWQDKKAGEASTIYQSLLVSPEGQTTDVKAEAEKLKQDYSSTPYAGRGAILAAKAAYTAKDAKTAKAQLQWAAEHAQESSVQAIAHLQLASILLEEKDYTAAHKALEAKLDSGYQGLKDEMLGNLYLAEGKQAEAKKAFENALINLDNAGALYQLTKQKMESLG